MFQGCRLMKFGVVLVGEVYVDLQLDAGDLTDQKLCGAGYFLSI